MEQKYKHLLFDKADGIVTVTLNRPERLNAMNRRLRNEIMWAMEDCQADDGVRVVILTGAGRAFCSGDDIRSANDPEEPVPLRTLYGHNHAGGIVPTIRAIRMLEKPVIAMVNGLAYGGGSELVMASDFCIASETATFCEPYMKRGFVGGIYQLPFLVGYKKATELLFFAEAISAFEACDLGLVNKVVPAEELVSATMELATKLSHGPTRAYGAAKMALNKTIGAGLEQIWQIASEAVFRTSELEDRQEGSKAFREGRDPKFVGR